DSPESAQRREQHYPAAATAFLDQENPRTGRKRTGHHGRRTALGDSMLFPEPDSTSNQTLNHPHSVGASFGSPLRTPLTKLICPHLLTLLVRPVSASCTASRWKLKSKNLKG